MASNKGKEEKKSPERRRRDSRRAAQDHPREQPLRGVSNAGGISAYPAPAAAAAVPAVSAAVPAPVPAAAVPAPVPAAVPAPVPAAAAAAAAPAPAPLSWAARASAAAPLPAPPPPRPKEPWEERFTEEHPYRVSHEASGDASYPLQHARELADRRVPFEMQVGIYEDGTDALPFMPRAEENIAALRRMNGPRQAIRVNPGRNATRSNSPTRYHGITVRNIMAAGEGGKSDTTRPANAALMQGVMQAQAPKLEEGGALHIQASGKPFFKPGKPEPQENREYGHEYVDVDQLARQARLVREKGDGYEDDIPALKNKGGRYVAKNGTLARVYRRHDERPVPTPPMPLHPPAPAPAAAAASPAPAPATARRVSAIPTPAAAAASPAPAPTTAAARAPRLSAAPAPDVAPAPAPRPTPAPVPGKKPRRRGDRKDQ